MLHAKSWRGNQLNRSVYRQRRRSRHRAHDVSLKDSELLKIPRIDTKNIEVIFFEEEKLLEVKCLITNELEAFFWFIDERQPAIESKSNVCQLCKDFYWRMMDESASNAWRDFYSTHWEFLENEMRISNKSKWSTRIFRWSIFFSRASTCWSLLVTRTHASIESCQITWSRDMECWIESILFNNPPSTCQGSSIKSWSRRLFRDMPSSNLWDLFDFKWVENHRFQWQQWIQRRWRILTEWHFSWPFRKLHHKYSYQVDVFLHFIPISLPISQVKWLLLSSKSKSWALLTFW